MISFMMESNTIEFLEWVSYLSVRSSETRVHRNTLHLAGFSSNINTSAFLDVAEVERVCGFPLVGDHWRSHVSNERPLCLSEEGVCFDI